jgi:tight adherence protein B
MSLWLLPAVTLMAFACVFCLAVLFKQALSGALRLWVQRFHLDVGERLGEQFIQIDVGLSLRVHAFIVVLGALLAGWLTSQWIAALVIASLVAVAPMLVARGLATRRLRRLAAQWPDALGLLAAGLRSGSGLVQAMTQAARELPAPCGQELGLCLKEQRLGIPLEIALMRLEDRARSEGLSLFVAAVRVSQETGGHLAETLDRLADTLRRKAALEGRIDALTAQGRLQGWVMVALPVAVAAALFLIEPGPMQALFSTWPGRFLVLVVAVLEACGLHVIRRITHVEV